ncbi:DNA polymerase III subunit alpha [Micromonospora chalcea]|uniref:DNA polymerase III subunit alpha n=1 Tax=Micromonospora chalcea TaxID=1874 RepID=UPI003D740D33
MADSFAHLHVHTEYSMLDGAAKCKRLFDEVDALGMPAVAMTDHGNLHGAPDFMKAARGAGAKPIIGVEMYKTPLTHRSDKTKVKWSTDKEANPGGGGAYTHMTVLAENATGLRNLMRLVSLSNLEGQVTAAGKAVPRVDEELLAQHAEGLIVTTGCLGGEVHTRLKGGNFDAACAAAGKLVEIFGHDNVFLEVMDHGITIERQVRADLLRVGQKLGLRPLATNDAHYVTADQAPMHDALLCLQTGSQLADAKRMRFDGEGYHIKSAAEMRAMWDDEIPGACDNTLVVAERVGPYDEVFAHRDLMPVFPVPEGHTPESYLRLKVDEGLVWRYPGGVPADRREQAEYEVGVIVRMGFPSYFLVVQDFVQWAKGQGIAVGPGRGSAAGSLVAYALGITGVDPMQFGLMFERFLNPDRVSMPDVDIDFDPKRRGEVIEYVTRRYGADRVASIGTFGRIKAKNAIKDSARVLGEPIQVGDTLSRLMPKAIMGSEAPLAVIDDVQHARYVEAGELRAYIDSEPAAQRVVGMAKQVEGYLRQTGVHPAGELISPVPLIDVVPLSRRHKDGLVITQWDMNAVEDLGLVKMDFLGLENLRVVANAVANIKANRDVDVDIETVPLDDPATFELLARGDTLGVFQLDGGPMRALLRSLRPTEFEDLSAVVALYRPGPMGADAHTAYADRKNGRATVEPIHEELAEALDPILADTYGVIVYQEQVIKIAQVVAGYTPARADLLRRAMGKKKKEVLDAEFEGFAAGMLANGFSQDAVDTLWAILVPFADYAFNKSHSVGYGLISYWTAYLKANYPAEYMAALLTSEADDKDKRALYLGECRRMGITVLPPDVNASQRDFTAVGADVRFGLLSVSGVGDGVVEAILRARAERGEAASFADWLAKADPAACKANTVGALIKAGAFDSMGHSRRGLFEIHADAIAAVAKGKKVEATGQESLFDLVAAEPDAYGAVAVDVPAHQWAPDVQLRLERDVLGLYVSGHPLQGLEKMLARQAKHSIAELVASTASGEDGERADEPAAYTDGQRVEVAGVVTSFERKISRKQKPYAVMTVEDRDGAAITVLLFAKALDGLGDAVHQIHVDAVVTVRGNLKGVDEGEVKIFGNQVGLVQTTTSGRADARRCRLTVRADTLTPQLARELRELSDLYPGPSPLVVELFSPPTSSSTFVALPVRVARTNLHFVRDASARFGPNCLAA